MNNTNNEEKDYEKLIKLDMDNKNNEESILYYEPDWVSLGRLSMTSDGRTVPTDPLYVPSNLLGDIENGNIDPEKYTREELRRMSFNKQHEQSITRQYEDAKQKFEKTKDKEDLYEKSKKI